MQTFSQELARQAKLDDAEAVISNASSSKKSVRSAK